MSKQKSCTKTIFNSSKRKTKKNPATIIIKKLLNPSPNTLVALYILYLQCILCPLNYYTSSVSLVCVRSYSELVSRCSEKINMASFIFDTCCGCIELRTGTLIIGYLQLVGYLIYTGIAIALLGAGGGIAATGDTEKDRQAGTAAMVVGGILLLIMVLMLAFTITLLVGVHKNKRGHVRAFLVFCYVFLVIRLVTIVFSFFQHGKTVQDHIGDVLGYILSLYFVLVIRSFYHKMEDSRKGTIYNTA